MSFSYATPTSGPSAGGIGWFNFGNISINPGDTLTGLTGTLSNGVTVAFDLSLALTSGQPRTFVSTIAPADPGSFFGRVGYTNIVGNVSLYSNYNYAGDGVNTFTMSNIVLLDTNNNPVSNYTVVLADSETTNTMESWVYHTDGGAWQQLALLGNNPPVLTGLGTQTATISGTQLFPQATQASYVLTTQSPLQVTIASHENASGRQGFSIGFAVTQVKLNKYIGARIAAADQFQLDIGGVPSSQAITTGTAIGFQAETAQVFATPNDIYTISEAMAAGSVSALSSYTKIATAANATPSGSIPSVGSLPISTMPILGDDITYTIFNAIPYTYSKTVDKSYADIGEILTYTVTIDNPNDLDAINVAFIDPTPLGTTYMGNLLVSEPYSGTDVNSGIVITSVPAHYFVTISWQVKINSLPPVPNPVINMASVIIPGGNSGLTNHVATNIRTAYVTVVKSVDKAYAQPLDILSYTLTIHNAGNAVANNLLITDFIPSGTAFVASSLVGATGTPPNLALSTPLAAGGTATVSFKVQVIDAMPSPNPLKNSAAVSFVYTVDPTKPNRVTGHASSNTVTTLVNAAELEIIKNSDRIVSYIGDVITYQISVTNNGSLPANAVVITDLLTTGTKYVFGSMVVSVPATGDPRTSISLVNPIAPGQTVTISFKVTVETIPNPNPILNKATADYAYTIDPQRPNGIASTAQSNTVRIPVFRNKFASQITELIQSVSLEQAALSAIANSEGAKIQKLAAENGVSAQELLCLNTSVGEMMEALAMLESVLKQKLNIIDCQLGGKKICQ